jgi:hypothetical protein
MGLNINQEQYSNTANVLHLMVKVFKQEHAFINIFDDNRAVNSNL